MNLINKKFGRWFVIEKDVQKRDYWICKCDCGTIRSVWQKNLLNKHSQSCGCISKEICSKRMTKLNTKHNLVNTKLYGVWHSMLQRCYYKRHQGYKNYGGRGIKVCDEWKNNFENFYKWAYKNGYKEELQNYGKNKWTIDRIDVNKDYAPNNCRWITPLEQGNNKRNNRFITYQNKTMTLNQWSRYLGINRVTLSDRLKSGWSIKDAFTKKVRILKKTKI